MSKGKRIKAERATKEKHVWRRKLHENWKKPYEEYLAEQLINAEKEQRLLQARNKLMAAAARNETFDVLRVWHDGSVGEDNFWTLEDAFRDAKRRAQYGISLTLLSPEGVTVEVRKDTTLEQAKFVLDGHQEVLAEGVL